MIKINKTQEKINQQFIDIMNLAMEEHVKNFGYDKLVLFSSIISVNEYNKLQNG